MRTNQSGVRELRIPVQDRLHPHRPEKSSQDWVQATLTVPDTSHDELIVLHPATATPRAFYRGFSEFAASRRVAVLTYDYRGTGDSGASADHPHLRMRDWMLTDAPAVSAWAAEEFGDHVQYGVGHSIGGHALVLGQGVDELTAFATVASHVAHTPSIPTLSERLRVAMVLHVVGPSLSRLVGRMPGEKLGLGADMPTAAMVEWGRWSRRRGYFFDDPTLSAADLAAAVNIPVLGIGASDDLWATEAQVDALLGHLTSAPVERRTYSPGDLDVRNVGHHGLLKRGVGERWWDELIDWFRAQR